MIKLDGTSYRLHPLFILLMVFSVFTGYLAEMLTLFGVVTIHELGHVAAAKGFEWRVKEVQLLPFGGVAVVEESYNVPAREELAVAACGPLQNLWMGLFAWLMVKLGWGDEAYWIYFLQANVMIGLFNLLPVLPLDGGKLLLGFLSYHISFYRAISGCLHVSLLLSVIMVLIALAPYPGSGIQLNLLAIGLFLFYSNWFSQKNLHYQFIRFLVARERRSARMAAEGVPPSPLMVPSGLEPLEVLRQFRREQHHLLYILGQSGTVMQIWPESRLVRVYLSRVGPPGGGRNGMGAGWNGIAKIG